MAETCDVIVLGMGTSGEDATLRLTRAGLDVVGVEEQLIGGECPYWACLPTKSLVRSAGLVAEARRADGLVGSVSVTPDWSVVARRLREEVTGGWQDAGGEERFTSRGGRLIRGRGTVTGPGTVTVGDTEVTARRGVLVATGSRPVIPRIPGLADLPYWTTREAVAAEELPASLVILGGGPVGCELGQIFARFGVDVTIIEGRDRLLAGEEPAASEVVAGALAADGVTVMTGASVVAVSRSDHGAAVHFADRSEVGAERLLVATGRRADADAVGVTAAGAATDSGFVVVDDRLRAADGLWAIGDVTGVAMLTEVALYQGMIAVADILGADPQPADYDVIPRAVFTDPEVGGVGLTEEAARAAGHDVAVVQKQLGASFRGWLHRTGNEGSVTLIADRSQDRLVGGSVIGPRASDVLGFLALAIRARVPLGVLVDQIYAFPTFYGGIGEALGAYGRGVVRVLDPATPPLVDDPPPSPS
jgi:pyruvate/2-oxoglutarate dehydrogenase complex dihydrolipoamide dehydrogenase (E3) component